MKCARLVFFNACSFNFLMGDGFKDHHFKGESPSEPASVRLVFTGIRNTSQSITNKLVYLLDYFWLCRQ